MTIEVNVSEHLGRRLGDYHRWREELIATIQSYQAWVEQEGLANGQDDLHVYELIEGLKSDKLTVAIVGEFSRGKSELINAIFFADYKQRLLPTEAGRTTMCPTELRYDADTAPCIRLLPIESRQSSQTISELKPSQTYWTTFPLELDSPPKIAEALSEIVKSKTVSIAQAQALGLYNPGAPGSGANVRIPVWRHAIVNYPHPLLQEGLVILDTPGLNSLGSEPELTMSMLPTAHVVMFVLAADTGVTKSDLQVWQDHVCIAKSGQNEGRIVVLNKIDTLWDELRGANAVEATISRQRQETAAALKVSKSHVFPISAQKGLLGKIKEDANLIAKSGLPALELELTESLVPAKQALIRAKVVREIGSIVETTAAMVETRLAATRAELKELHGLSGKNLTIIENMMIKKTQAQEAYEKQLANIENTKQVLGDQVRLLLNYLSMEALDDLIAKTRKDMKGSWTTHGLKGGMKTFFEGAMTTMDKVQKQTERMKTLLETIYKQFQVGHGLTKIKLDSFVLEPHYNGIKRLYEEAEAFRNSPAMVMTEQHFVVKKFFITLVSRARHIFDESNKAAEIWSKAVMAPVFAQIREHKLMMDQRVQNLRKIHQSLKHLNVRINELEAAKKRLEDQQRASRGILAKIEQPMPPASEANHAAEDEAPTEERTRDEAATEELATARGAA